MAKIDNIGGTNQINLTASVGRNGTNHKDDVIAVQAMLKYALEGTRGWENSQFPQPTGTMDAQTMSLIRKFQRSLRRSNPSASVDGRIDPAKGQLTRGKRAMWTIIALNTEAMETWLLNKRLGANYIHAVGLLYPAFKNAVGDEGVGTLNLPLEGSSNGVGSLGLELE
ncbi:MAG TPA: hypothetical protein PKD24_02595 [Pyrinomonadaceae bacterium]|nr:hypothetical protein [Pyrinomonadaceae bacterium]HMP63953.1 hypothetical protein [Pyrinomonadaceae bacterium]